VAPRARAQPSLLASLIRERATANADWSCALRCPRAPPPACPRSRRAGPIRVCITSYAVRRRPLLHTPPHTLHTHSATPPHAHPRPPRPLAHPLHPLPPPSSRSRWTPPAASPSPMTSWTRS
jgi:hypothetical protein